ncbi:hypothetical protein ACFL47_10950 [Candidatus Latescibacterota bacterium]
MENDEPTQHDSNEEPPPVFSSWNRLYTLVFINLVVLIVLFYVFTRVFQ